MASKSLRYTVLSVIFATIFCSYASYRWILAQFQSELSVQTSTLVELKAGQSANQVLHYFAEQGWIAHTWVHKIMFKLHPEFSHIKSGVYEVLPGMTGQHVWTMLHEGQVKQFQLSLVEGLRWRDWYQQLTKQPYLADTNISQQQVFDALMPTPQGDSVEGWLMPDTYHYTSDATLLSIVERSYQAMLDYLQNAWEHRQIGLPLNSPYEALILASIIEKETGVPHERPRIAGVFINRLNLGMRLQTDPTVIYGMGEAFDGNIRRQDLRTKTAYNTYRIDGLPPTPIAMPSRAAIDAALNPVATDELYFVAKGDGSHQFSVTLQEHNAAVRKYQLKKSN